MLATNVSVSISRCRHFRRSCFRRHSHRVSAFLRPFAPPELPGFHATMDALTPDGPLFRTTWFLMRVSPHQGSLLTLSYLPSVLSPITLCCPGEDLDFLHRVYRRNLMSQKSCPRGPSVSGFAFFWEARHSNRPTRVRQPTDRTFASGCSPPRLTATQLPSATRNQTFLDEDSHLADTTPSQAH